MTITLRAGVLNSGIQQNGTEFLTVDTSNTVSLSAALPVLSGGTGVTTKTGTGAVVLGTSPTITGATITVAATAAPAFSAYLSANQTTGTGTTTKVQYNTESFDTNSNYDPTTNYRFTPTVAGYYYVSALINASAASGIIALNIYKNGGRAFAGNAVNNVSNILQYQIAGIVSMNGSTDYIEIYMFNGSGGNLTYYAGSDTTAFSAFFVRNL